jgi:hypothetical protein
MSRGLLRCTLAPAVLLAALASISGRAAADSLDWHADYNSALALAKQERKLLLVYFRPAAAQDGSDALESVLARDPVVFGKLSRLVAASLPQEARITAEGRSIRLLDHRAFLLLDRKPGVAVVDFTQPDSERYGHVVAAVPVRDLPVDQPRALVAALEQQHPLPAPRESEAVWHTDYAAAMQAAQAAGKLLLIYFQDPQPGAIAQRFEESTLTDPLVRQRLRNYVLAALPTDARINVDGQPVALLRHPAFQYMYGRSGVAIIDTVSRHPQLYKHVISAFPLSQKHQYTPQQMCVMLDLPMGTITQRTLIYAVRTHREAPASTNGTLHPLLAREAERHSLHQASINLQGHHNWSDRFQQITGRLPGGMSAVEVCAESWPGEELVDAAVECVHSWRQSSGHWSAVRSRQTVFGYDMKLGTGRIWYATGIFGGH